MNEEKSSTSHPSPSNPPSIQELFALAQKVNSHPPITLSEQELRTSAIRKPQRSIFANPDMIAKYEALPEDVKNRFRTYGHDYYSNVIDTVNNSLDRAASDVIRAVRAGLSPRDLSEDDKIVVRTIYGKEWYKLANLESEEDD